MSRSDQRPSARKLLDDALRGVEVVVCPQCSGLGLCGPPAWRIPCPRCLGCGESTINNEEHTDMSHEDVRRELEAAAPIVDENVHAGPAEDEPDETDESDEVSNGSFRITKFSRHPDGYFHARVTANGTTYYVHRRNGSWMAPGTVPATSSAPARDVLKEVLPPYREALAKRARSWESAEKRRHKVMQGEARVAMSMDYPPEQIAEALMDRYSLTQEQADKIVAETQLSVVRSNTDQTTQEASGHGKNRKG